jgi:hypothetical protein
MKENEILEGIHCVRAEMARACDFDVDKIVALAREQLGDLTAQGWKMASFPPRPAQKPGAVHEDPPDD